MSLFSSFKESLFITDVLIYTEHFQISVWVVMLLCTAGYLALKKSTKKTESYQTLSIIRYVMVICISLSCDTELFCFTEKIDGGSENVARAALAICHLLVARRLTKKVVATRLLVGHTHEDIDAVFALIWQLMKTMQVNTPQLYAKVVRSACKNKAPEVEVYDIWAVPDYKSFIEPFIDKKLGRYAKGNCLSNNF